MPQDPEKGEAQLQVWLGAPVPVGNAPQPLAGHSNRWPEPVVTHRDSSSSPGTATLVPAEPLPLAGAPTSCPPFPQEDTATALQRLVELTATRVTPLRSLSTQYRLIRKLGSGCYGRVLLARPRLGGESTACHHGVLEGCRAYARPQALRSLLSCAMCSCPALQVPWWP